ncbi:MAG TPA: acyloxyacyl hydrolase [Thermoanaerobaculia bacterium]|nr:acyloxyacyl hydrolase [Thermoanaerobaculia bacterium]
MRKLAIVLATLLATSASAQAFDDIRLYVLGGKSTTTWHGQADLQALNLELGHALTPRTTVGVVIAPVNLWQPRSWFGDQFGDGNESVRALSAALLLRHKWREGHSIQPYIEVATGPMYAEKRVPASTSRFNFVSQGGAGVVFNGDGRFPFFAGYRVMHISNGGYAPRNPGLNVGAAVVGVQLRSATTRRR